MTIFEIKEYQQSALQTLQDYFRTCLQYGKAELAFYDLTGRAYQHVRELPGLPYVCFRMPTGAGKTFVAAHAAALTIREYLQADQSLVLWLVPSNAIREQTLIALKDRSHPYRNALDQALGGVSVMDISEALYLPRPTLDTSTVVIVSTIQAFRVDDTEGRKVYETSGALMDHFSNLPEDTLVDLERIEGSAIPKYSLANVLRLRRPVVVIDEAHNARTPLTFDVLARFNPACILEFTATPDSESSNPSNILHQVSAAELKAEDMIKLPINIQARQNWTDLLSDAIAQLDHLDKAARQEESVTGEHIRPIMLLQAQPNRQGQETLTIDVLRDKLIQDFKIPEKAIARHGQGYKELDDLDILQSDSPIRFVLTVSALKEGWDCPFAYVLCSVAEMRSATSIEQILGRVMRMPHAKRKQNNALNQAYAFAVSTNFMEVAQTLKDGLVQNGFERIEAEQLVRVPEQPELDFSDLPIFSSPKTITILAPEKPNLDGLPEEIAKKVSVNDAGALVYSGPITDTAKESISQAFTTPEARAAVESAFHEVKSEYEYRSPAEQGVAFNVPVLAYKQGNLLEQFEETHFLEVPWRLSQQSAELNEEEYPSQPASVQAAQIDITDQRKLTVNFIPALHQQMRLLASDHGWTIAELVNWLDRTIPHPDITPAESAPFILKTINYLLNERSLHLDQLVHDKYQLRKAVAVKIDGHRKAHRTQAYQGFLIDESPLVVTPELVFSFDPLRYPCKPYQGGFKFNKHYYADVGDLDNPEEVECAAYLDSLPQVGMWVRNPSKGSKAFWLQTSTDKFYPDFVCKLKDGRYLVVEYKGADRWSNDDSREKRELGEVWALRSNGQCLFAMPKGKDWGAIDRLL
jgi:type III restriction enzyme